MRKTNDLAQQYKLSEEEVLLICSNGEFIIKINDFDSFNEHMQVSEGEEGRKHEIFFAVTSFGRIQGDRNIYHYFTKEDL